MEKKCEICSAVETPDNILFSIRIAEEAEDGEKTISTRAFCEVCLGYGAEMYESYMVTKMTPKSPSGCSKATH